MRLIDADALIEKLDAFCVANCPYSVEQRKVMCGACMLGSAFDVVDDMPSVQPSIKDAISAIRQFLDSGKFITTCKFITEDGVCLMTDWGYFEEGLDEFERYAKKGKGGKH